MDPEAIKKATSLSGTFLLSLDVSRPLSIFYLPINYLIRKIEYLGVVKTKNETFEFFTIRISVRLSDRSLHREEQKKIGQELPPVGIKLTTSGSSL